MKKIFAITLSVLLISSTSFASGEEVIEGMGERIKRGFVNLVTSPIEFPHQIIKGYRNGLSAIDNEAGSKIVGTVLGIFRGAGHTAGRMSYGALELFGFWAVSPTDNEGVGVPLDAEYAWEEGVQYSIFDPSFEEGVKPIGHKLTRGLGNGLFGIIEIPGQTLRGASNGNVVKGVLKGFWYAMSRGLYGLGDIYSVFAPNPPDNAGGIHFDGKWPWTVLSEEMEN